MAKLQLRVILSFCICHIIYTFFYCFEWLFLFHSVWWYSSHSLNFDKFHDTAPLSSPILNNCRSPAGAWVTCRINSPIDPFRRHILTMWITEPAVSYLTPSCSRLCSSFSLLGSPKSRFRWAPIGILHLSPI